MTRARLNPTHLNRESWVHKSSLTEEMRSKLHIHALKLRQVRVEPSLFNMAVNTPEFSRFSFGVPTIFLMGMTAVSLSGPTTLPLIYEKMIPYHIKTISVASAFYAFTDVAANVLGRPTITSHLRWKRSLFLLYGLASLIGSTVVMVVGDNDPHMGYKASLGLLALHAIPTAISPMEPWVRFRRVAFLSLGIVSVIGSELKLRYLESHWEEVVFSVN